MIENNNPLVSVIIPLYNAELYIAETIESVINQTYQNWEILIVDDLSTDTSREIVNVFVSNDNRIRLIESDINFGGPARPRNIGLKNCKGDYVAFLDADDVWLSEKLEVQLKYMQENNLNFTSTDALNIDNNSDTIKSMKNVLLSFFTRLRSKVDLCDLIKDNFIITSSVMAKNDSILHFNENPDFIAVEDMYLWMQMLNEANINYNYISSKLLKYRILSTSISQRVITHKQNTKANLCILKFVLDHKRFDIIIYFYIRIIKHFVGLLLKKKNT